MSNSKNYEKKNPNKKSKYHNQSLNILNNTFGFQILCMTNQKNLNLEQTNYDLVFIRNQYNLNYDRIHIYSFFNENFKIIKTK